MRSSFSRISIPMAPWPTHGNMTSGSKIALSPTTSTGVLPSLSTKPIAQAVTESGCGTSMPARTERTIEAEVGEMRTRRLGSPRRLAKSAAGNYRYADLIGHAEEPGHRERRRDVRVRGQDDLAAGLHAGRFERDAQRVEPRADADGVLRADHGGEALLEFIRAEAVRDRRADIEPIARHKRFGTDGRSPLDIGTDHQAQYGLAPRRHFVHYPSSH